jgi:eukaryotic-like serine/threonine-protein kinase
LTPSPGAADDARVNEARRPSARGPAEGGAANVVLDGRWRLLRKIAEGAMGSVHEAVHVQTQARAAVKLLRPELHADASIRRRFRREASVLQALEHPGVVRVLELGNDDGERSYTVMELLTGETLEAWLAREPQPRLEVLGPILTGIAEALAAIHEHGVIHGDVKPANVFLPAGATFPVRLVDFGLSKIEGLERLTRTGELTGTPVYMAPELLTGRGEIDARIDVYAAGVVAYLALAGRLPFSTQRHPGALMFDIVMGKLTPLAMLRPELPAGLLDAVAHAMAPKRDERTPDAGRLRAELEQAFASAGPATGAT